MMVFAQNPWVAPTSIYMSAPRQSKLNRYSADMKDNVCATREITEETLVEMN